MKSGDVVNAAKAILVVDDEPAILESIVEVLRDEATRSSRRGTAKPRFWSSSNRHRTWC
jgi:CheY-like chemotaxis protein